MPEPRVTRLFYFQHLDIAAYRVSSHRAEWILMQIKDPETRARRYISLADFEQEYRHLQPGPWYRLNHKRFGLIEAYEANNALPGAAEWERMVAGVYTTANDE